MGLGSSKPKALVYRSAPISPRCLLMWTKPKITGIWILSFSPLPKDSKQKKKSRVELPLRANKSFPTTKANLFLVYEIWKFYSHITVASTAEAKPSYSSNGFQFFNFEVFKNNIKEQIKRLMYRSVTWGQSGYVSKIAKINSDLDIIWRRLILLLLKWWS